MKQLLICAILLLSISVFGQEKAVIKNKHFYIGINFSPDYCYRLLNKNNDSMPNERWIKAKNLLDSIELSKFGYTAGISFGYQIRHWLSIETGIEYSNKGYKTVPILTIFDFNRDPEIAKNIYNYSYLDIPLKANFIFLKKKIQIFTGLGIVANILLKTKVKTIPEKPSSIFPVQTHVDYYAYDKINISPTFSVGLQYNIIDKLFVRLEPIFRFGLLNFDSKSYKATHLWNAGVNINLNFRF